MHMKQLEKEARRYDISEGDIRKGIKKAIHDALFFPVTLEERSTVLVKPKFETACWTYLPPHRIYIGDALFEKSAVKLGLSPEQQEQYIANHYHHEIAHAMFTERDMKKIERMLASIDCPFGLFNLFEDAWIEHRYRGQTGYAFQWLSFEDLTVANNPQSMLFALIQAEGDVSRVAVEVSRLEAAAPAKPEIPAITPADNDEQKTPTQLFARVCEYYQHMLAARCSLDQMQTLQAWLAEFGRPPAQSEGEKPSSGPGFGSFDGELELSAELMNDPGARAEFEGDAVDLDGISEKDKANEVANGPGAKFDHSSLVAQNGDVLGRPVFPVDPVRAQALAEKLKRLFQDKTQVVGTYAPQRRISARHFVLDRAPYRKKEMQGRKRKQVHIVFDCSGSMRGHHVDEGRVLLAALSLLATQGLVSGHVSFSGVFGRQARWETHRLPLSFETIARVKANAGAEGLEFTLRENLKDLVSADLVFVYTDACITDRPIDRKFFRSRGVYLWGLYAGTEKKYYHEMMEYFDRATLRDTVEELVEAMLVY